jgi:hypothetical protein
MYGKKYLIPFVLFLIVFEYCEKSETTKADEPTSFVSFYDQGSVEPDPISSLVIIQDGSIKYQSIQNGEIKKSWSANILSAEYSHINSIIDNNELIGSQDPTGGQICDGSLGIIIIIKNENIIDTLTIAGIYMCDRDIWPQGLDSLINYKNALVDKYRPE